MRKFTPTQYFWLGIKYPRPLDDTLSNSNHTYIPEPELELILMVD